MQPDLASAETAPSHEEMLTRARALLPAVAARADESETLRRIPDATIADFQAAGLFRTLQPRRWDGYELEPATFYDAIAEIATVDASTAWVLGVVGIHNWHVALFPEQAQREVWGDDTSVLVASSYAPIGTVEHVPGGFKVSGRWSFSSGTDHCHWVLVNSVVPELGNPQRRHGYTFLLQRSDYRIVDDWHVSGLAGTGSKTFVVENAFVPEHRAISLTSTRELRAPGLEVNPSPLYRIPQMVIFLYAVSAPMVGLARGMLKLYLEQAERRIAGNAKAPLLSDAFAQEAVARAFLDIRATEERMHRDLDEIIGLARTGSSFPYVDRARFRWGAAYLVDTSLRAIDTLFETAGGFSIHSHNPMQRMFRDAHAMRAHASNNVRRAAQGFGAAMMGLTEGDGVL